MNNQEDKTDQELADFLNGESGINKIYAEREMLSAPAHLEFSVKQMAREDLSRKDLSREDLSGDDLSRYDRSETDKPASGSGVQSSSTTKSRKFFMSITLAASILVALTLTVILFQDQSAQVKLAQNPDNNKDVVVSDKPQVTLPETVQKVELPISPVIGPVSDVAQQENDQGENNQLAQQRVTPAPQVQITNDVRKPKIEKREQLATNIGSPKRKAANPKQDTPRLAQPVPYEVPAHINELLQNTNASDQKLNGMPPVEILRSWQKSQWVEQVKVLNKQGKRDLAERYVQAYPDYFPNDSINYLLQPSLKN